jgi:hypothetical protein
MGISQRALSYYLAKHRVADRLRAREAFTALVITAPAIALSCCISADLHRHPNCRPRCVAEARSLSRLVASGFSRKV